MGFFVYEDEEDLLCENNEPEWSCKFRGLHLLLENLRHLGVLDYFFRFSDAYRGKSKIARAHVVRAIKEKFNWRNAWKEFEAWNKEKDYRLNSEDPLLDPEVEPTPQPKPISPIREVPEPVTNYFNYTFFGTVCQVRLGEEHQFILDDCEEGTLAEAWEWLSGKDFDNVLRDCLELRIRLKLSDWAYLLMLQELSQSFLGKDTNEATLLMAYLFGQSGYEMRLAEAKGRLYLLFGSRYAIYERAYWQIGDAFYYPLDCKEETIRICRAGLPNEQPLSLQIVEEPLLAMDATPVRTLQAESFSEIKVSLQANRNLLDFMETYPTSMIGDNFCTRWALYANAPLSKAVKDKLYPVLKKAIKEKTQVEAANMLINFVQTAFIYEYDDKVWGKDRAFFADETLYYPYCDCEDRSILFTRLVRDLLGLKTALVYYPGHLATAVCFTENVSGDYLLLDNHRYLICDPTYIGAPIGVTMPDMDNKTAKVILLGE